MVDEKEVKEVAETPKEITVGNESCGNTVPSLLLLLLIVPLLIVSCTLLYIYTSYQAKPDNNITLPVETPTPELIISANENNTILWKRIKVQPNCTTQLHVGKVLKKILAELRLKKEMCTPEDFHNMEKHIMPRLASSNNNVPEPKGHFVIYIAVGLLLTSLVAAFVDVYKVKGKPSKTKPQLTKRCSLADLTVLRHSRRESMRKDSIVDEQRVPLKLLGARPPPELRRCSYPVYSGEPTYGQVSPRQGSRKTSLDCCDDLHHNNRVVRLIRRF